MLKKDYYDERGIKRRVLVPSDDIPLSEGIPVSLPLENLYVDAPTEFVVRLTNALFARGLVEPEDFMKPGAAELVRVALLDTLRFDAQSIVSLANEHKGK